MMYGRGKSDSAIVAVKPPNKAGEPVAEAVEQRAETKGNAAQRSTRRAQNRGSVSHALDVAGCRSLTVFAALKAFAHAESLGKSVEPVPFGYAATIRYSSSCASMFCAISRNTSCVRASG